LLQVGDADHNCHMSTRVRTYVAGMPSIYIKHNITPHNTSDIVVKFA